MNGTVVTIFFQCFFDELTNKLVQDYSFLASIEIMRNIKSRLWELDKTKHRDKVMKRLGIVSHPRMAISEDWWLFL